MPTMKTETVLLAKNQGWTANGHGRGPMISCVFKGMRGAEDGKGFVAVLEVTYEVPNGA